MKYCPADIFLSTLTQQKLTNSYKISVSTVIIE